MQPLAPRLLLAELTNEQLAVMAHDWELWARPSQLPPPGDWMTWAIITGRGWGKTRTASEWVRSRVESGAARSIALVGRTPADARDVMIEDAESGLLNVFPDNLRPDYEPSKRRITFHTGAQAIVYSSENPDQLRGPQFDTAWCDELATFSTPEAWDNLQLGLRVGQPRQIVTTTPRPVRTVRDLLNDEENVAITRGTTYENRSNLAPAFFRQIIRRYAGTRRGQQEIEGLLLDDVPGALWQRSMFDTYRDPPELRRVLIGVDPSVGDSDEIAECGIVVVGEGVDGNYYVLADKSLRGSPNRWAHQVISTYYERPTDRVVAEVNQGGALVELTLRTIDENVSYTAVRASVGKQARAEPVSALYEQGRVYHVEPFEELEDQLCTWVSGEGPSPDRLDALVWAMHELALKPAWSIIIE